MKITSKDFREYRKVQIAGTTNMMDIKLVCKLTKLTKEKVIEIMKNYPKYYDLEGWIK